MPVIAIICNKHGFQKASICPICPKENINRRHIGIKISNRPYDYGKGMDGDEERRIALERTGGWDG